MLSYAAGDPRMRQSKQPLLPTPVPKAGVILDEYACRKQKADRLENRRLVLIGIIIAALIAFAIPIASLAGDVGPLGRVTYTARVSGAVFTDLAINSSKTTDSIKTDGWNEVTVWIDYTWSSATYVNMTCEEQRYGDTTTWYQIPMCNDSSPPDSTCGQLRKRFAVSDDVAWRWRIPIMGYNFRCSFVTTGGDSGDTASVRYVGGQQ
jgi:hypothetical protein